jgi:bacteriorhodopsin
MLCKDEYEPLLGSPRISPRKLTALVTGGLAVMAVATLGLVMLSAPEAAAIAPAALALDDQGSAQAATSALSSNTLPISVETQAASTTKLDATTELSVATSFTTTQYDLIYNFFSFAIAAMGSATVFFFFQFSMVHPKFRTALLISGIVTMIAFYHYMRIFNSFVAAYVSSAGTVTTTGVPFNDAYRYVDWLLTVPLLLMEIILVMLLGPQETRQKCISLGTSSAIMIILGYPGEISESMMTRWIFWALAMIPFLYIVYTLFVGLSDSIEAQPKAVKGLVSSACYITVISWCTYPIVFIFPMLGLTGYTAKTAVQIGYTIADVVAKPIMGVLVWMIAVRKSENQNQNFAG